MPPTFVLAGVKDIDVLVQFMRGLHEDDPTEGGFDESRNVPAMKELLSDESRGPLWLIRLNDVNVGYVALTFGHSIELGGRDAFVDELYIVAAHRSKGIGSATMEFIEAESRKLGVRALHLEVTGSNGPATKLYAKRGFVNRPFCLMTKRL